MDLLRWGRGQIVKMYFVLATLLQFFPMVHRVRVQDESRALSEPLEKEEPGKELEFNPTSVAHVLRSQLQASICTCYTQALR